MITDRKGNGAIHNFRDVDIDDIIGMSVVLQGRYEDFAYRSPLQNNPLVAAQTGAEQVTMGACNCGAGNDMPILTPNPMTGAATPLMLPCGEDPCPEAYCIANGFSCPTCSGLPSNCFSNAAETMPVSECPADPTCMATVPAAGGLDICFDCTACTTAQVEEEPFGCLTTTSILNRPACGVIEEVECPQPEYIKNVLY